MIYKADYNFLFSVALNSKHPDIVRQNCYIALSTLNPLALDIVKIEISEEYSEKVKRQGLHVITARVSYASGILPYLKKSVLKDFYFGYYEHMKQIGYGFKSSDKYGNLLREFQEVSGLAYCHDDVLRLIIEWLCLCYVGEKSFGQYSASRKVFYSNIGAPLAFDILVQSKERIRLILDDIITKSPLIKTTCQSQYCKRRVQEILDAVQ